jgi:hypothetical protein
MPKTPDFETMAERIAPPPSTIEPGLRRTLVGMIVEHLTIVWNARGAADLAKVEHVLSSLMGATASGPYTKNLDRELRSLDR